MVSNLQHYPYVAVTNKTPYATTPPYASDNWPPHYIKYGISVAYALLNAGIFCSEDLVTEVIPSGGTWTASSRGACLVGAIYARVNPDGRSYLECTPYKSSGTSYSIFSIIMKGDDACCVLSSHETQTCPWIKRWNELEIVMGCDAWNDDDENCANYLFTFSFYWKLKFNLMVLIATTTTTPLIHSNPINTCAIKLEDPIRL